MKQLFWNTITNPMREVLEGFMQSNLASSFYLAGGTALSLQIGHRLSVDLDFDNAEEETNPVMLKVVDWHTVKNFFIEQAKTIEKGWLL